MGVRISFIATTKNRSSKLRNAIHGWSQLKSPLDEIIVIDGGSNDDTAAILSDSRGVIDNWRSELDVSEAHAINKGILMARGEYLKFLTDDDVFYARGIEMAVAAMAANPDIDILHCGGQCVAREVNGSFKTLWFQKLEDAASWIWWGTRCGLGMTVRRSAIAKIGLFDVRHRLADTSFLIQATQRGAVQAFLMEKMFLHIRDGSSFTANATRVQMEHHMRCLAKDHALPQRVLYSWLYPKIFSLLKPKRVIKHYLTKWARRGNIIEEPLWTGLLVRKNDN